jgi:hypothetical protein
LGPAAFRAAADMEISAALQIHAAADFYNHLPPMGPGWWWAITDVAGIQPGSPWAGSHIVTAPGYGPTADGFGKVMSRGAGPVIITVRGFLIRTMDGSGFPGWNGRRAGFVGASVAGTSGGRRVHPGAGPSMPGRLCSLTRATFMSDTGRQP